MAEHIAAVLPIGVQGTIDVPELPFVRATHASQWS